MACTPEVMWKQTSHDDTIHKQAQNESWVQARVLETVFVNRNISLMFVLAFFIATKKDKISERLSWWTANP